VQKAEALFGLASQRPPIGARRFEKMEAADDVGLDKVLGTMNRAIDVRFGGKVDDRPRLVLRQQAGPVSWLSPMSPCTKICRGSSASDARLWRLPA
jgi:hypothetical protein